LREENTDIADRKKRVSEALEEMAIMLRVRKRYPWRSMLKKTYRENKEPMDFVQSISLSFHRDYRRRPSGRNKDHPQSGRSR
jgi:hypothetical protein